MVGSARKQALLLGEQLTLQPLAWRLQDPLVWPPADASSSEPLLWSVDCRDPLPRATREALQATLTTEEQQRCKSYRLPDDRERFLRARAGLRLLLAAWLACPPSSVILEVGRRGKPFCPGGPQFNLSHSGDLILLALHPRCRVGIDVEKIRPGFHWQPIADRVLTKSQQAVLQQLPAESQLMAFLADWCALEAELKAIGSGFSGMHERRRASSTSWRDDDLCWELKLPKGYVGVVVALPESVRY